MTVWNFKKPIWNIIILNANATALQWQALFTTIWLKNTFYLLMSMKDKIKGITFIINSRVVRQCVNQFVISEEDQIEVTGYNDTTPCQIAFCLRDYELLSI